MAHLGWELGSAPLPPTSHFHFIATYQEERNQEMRCPMGTVWGPPRRALCHSNPSVNTGHNQLGAIEYRERGKEEGRLSWVPRITGPPMLEVITKKSPALPLSPVPFKF